MPEAEDHFQSLTRRQQVIVLDMVEKQLQYQPDVETRNRKPMRLNRDWRRERAGHIIEFKRRDCEC